MIKEALEYIVELGKPELKDVGGKIYSDRQMKPVCPVPYAEPVRMTTLTGFVHYIRSGIDTMKGRMIIQVAAPDRVLLFSQLDNDRKREYVAEVTAMLPEFKFGKFHDQESFCISLQSKFVNNKDRGLLLKFGGTVEAGTVAEYGDDGVSQKATVKTGIASKSDAIVPNPVKLAPFRTFTEVSQPESDFIFRMKDGEVIYCALFEADGGAWKNEAMNTVREWLIKNLEGMEGFTVIS